jgi:hypothetical protein
VTGQLLTVDGGHTLRAFPDQAAFMGLPDWQQIARDAHPAPAGAD